MKTALHQISTQLLKEVLKEWALLTVTETPKEKDGYTVRVEFFDGVFGEFDLPASIHNLSEEKLHEMLEFFLKSTLKACQRTRNQNQGNGYDS